MLLRSVSLFYLAYAVRLLAPLLSLMVVARSLTPAEYGVALLATSAAALLSVGLDFGFSLSALRDLAGARTDEDQRVILERVLSAKALLTPPMALIAGIIIALSPAAAGRLTLPLFGAGLGLIQGWSMPWYLQAKNKPLTLMGLEVSGQAAALLLNIVLTARLPTAGSYLFAQSVGALMPFAATLAMARAALGPMRLQWREGLAALRAGATLAAARGSSAFYTAGANALASYVLPAAALGAYSLADRLYAQVTALYAPAAQAIIPFVVRHGTAGDGGEAGERTGLLMRIYLAAGVTAAAGLFLTADPLVPLLFGAKYAASVSVLRVLGLSLPLISASQVMGLFILLPRRQDRFVTGALALGTVGFFAAGWGLGAAGGAQGFAFARVISEGLVTAAMAAALWRASQVRRAPAGSL